MAELYLVEAVILEVNGSAAQLAGAVEYAYCISAEGYPPSQHISGYDDKRSDGEAQILELCHYSQVHFDRSGSTR